MAVDPRNFLLNTDYPMDKIAGSFTGSKLVAGSSSETVTLSHAFGAAVLPIVKWSTTSNFAVSYEESSTNTVAGYGVLANSDTDSVNIIIGNNNAGAGTIYYRVYYFMPYDADVDVLATASGLGNFVINTDYNYSKVFLEGRTTANPQTITHNLGYYPQIEAWNIRSGVYRHVMYGESYGGTVYDMSITVTTTTAVFTSATANDRFYYRIYADEN
jgi:hypothetical protein